MPKIEVKGLDKLQKALKEKITLDDVKQVVSKNGQALQRNMQREADFTRGYQTGQTKRSIALTCKTAVLLPRLGQKRNTAHILSMALALWMHKNLYPQLTTSKKRSLSVTWIDLSSDVC